MERLTMTREQREAENVEYPVYLAPRVIREWDARLAAYEDTGMMPEEVVGMKDEIEAGRLVKLPAAIRQMVYVPSGDGGIYAAYVKGIGVLRPDSHDAIMRAMVRVGTENEVREYLIAPENRGTHWFATEAEARAALEKGASDGLD